MAKVGEFRSFRARWKKDGVFVTTGSAFVSIRREASSGPEYLQADGLTFASAFHERALAHDGLHWALTVALALPAAAKGFVLFYEWRHTDADLSAISDWERVTEVDADDLAEVGDVEFLGRVSVP